MKKNCHYTQFLTTKYHKCIKCTQESISIDPVESAKQAGVEEIDGKTIKLGQAELFDVN